ncbi:MAG TPA: preQ(1) synthase [Bacillota bacterium]
MPEEPATKKGFERRYDVDGPEAIDKEVLDTIPYEYPGRKTLVEIEHPEFTSVCPWSGLPDFAELKIRYVPRTALVELKSLKYYLHSYRNVGIWQEHAVNRILDDLVELLDPHWMEITARFNVRGGSGTVITARYPYEEVN